MSESSRFYSELYRARQAFDTYVDALSEVWEAFRTLPHEDRQQAFDHIEADKDTVRDFMRANWTCDHPLYDYPNWVKR